LAVLGTCSVCDYEKTHDITIDTSMSPTRWEGKTGVSRYSIIRHLKHEPAPPKEKVLHAASAGDSFANNDGNLVITKTADRIIPLSEWHDDLVADGFDPNEFTTSHGHSVWAQRSTEEGLVTLYANKFSAVKKTAKELGKAAVYAEIDPAGILAQLRADHIRIEPTVTFEGEASAFVVSINDIQLGQSYNGGSKATIANFHRYIEMARQRILELRKIGRRLDTLVVVIGGDLVEGCVIYANQAMSLDMHRKQQVEGIVALLLHALDTLAPLFETVKVLACKGNHGEQRINGKKTALGDNDDTHCVEMAKLGLSRDPTMQHITWTIAEDEAAVWVDVYGWTLVTTHGDIYAKGVSGATTERKAHAWLKNMAAAVKHFGKIGRADVLITHHFHHDEMADWGDCLWRQTTSQDRGSPEFSQASGTYSEPGMLTGVMMPGHRWCDEQVLY